MKRWLRVVKTPITRSETCSSEYLSFVCVFVASADFPPSAQNHRPGGVRQVEDDDPGHGTRTSRNPRIRSVRCHWYIYFLSSHRVILY